MESEFRLPALGADMEEGTVVQWNVAPGDKVKRGQVVAVIETDKGAIDVEIFEDAVIREIVVQPGTKVAVGTVLARLETAAPPSVAAPSAMPDAAMAHVPAAVTSATSAQGKAEERPSGGRTRISPAARVRARELGVELSGIAGSGPGGAISIEDVERAKSSALPA